MSAAFTRELALAALRGELCTECGLPYPVCHALDDWTDGLRNLIVAYDGPDWVFVREALDEDGARWWGTTHACRRAYRAGPAVGDRT